jgi:nitrite reductase/ring-hydroxylating ferredoxin subunit
LNWIAQDRTTTYTAAPLSIPYTRIPFMPITEPGWSLAAQLSEFGPDNKLACTVDGIEILLIRREHGVVAVHNRCTHLQKPLTAGRVFAGQIICPMHGACFDLRSGKALSGPAVASLRIFPTKVEEGAVWVGTQ